MQKIPDCQYLHVNSFQVVIFSKPAFLKSKDFKRKLKRSFFIFTHSNSDFLFHEHMQFALLGW